MDKGLFGKNGTVLLGDCFCCGNGLSILKRKEKCHLYGERNRTVVSKQVLRAYLAKQDCSVLRPLLWKWPSHRFEIG